MISDSAWLAQRKTKIGDKFKIYERDFEIVGTYAPSAGARVKIPLATMQAQLALIDTSLTNLTTLGSTFAEDFSASSLPATAPSMRISSRNAASCST